MMIFHKYVILGPHYTKIVHQESLRLPRLGRRVLLHHRRDVVAAGTLGTVGEVV